MPRYCEHCGSVLDDKFGSRTFGDLSIVQGSRELWCNDRCLRISPTHEAILFDLMTGKPLTKQAAIMRHARSEESEDKTLDTQICKIRAELREIQTTVEIRTLWGVGWQMVDNQPEYEQRAFGDVIFDLDRRLVIKGKTLVPVYPQVFETFQILLSGDLEPLGKFERLGKAGARWLIDQARQALKKVDSKIQIRNFQGRGYQMTA